MNKLVFSHVLLSLVVCFAIPDQGKWSFSLDEHNYQVTVVKSLFKDSNIYATIHCETRDETKGKVKVTWSLRESACFQDYLRNYHMEEYEGLADIEENTTTYVVGPHTKVSQCNGIVSFAEIEIPVEAQLAGEESKKQIAIKRSSAVRSNKGASGLPLYQVTKDGFYIFTVLIEGAETKFLANLKIEMLGKYGYLSAADWPLLPFYGGMCLVYVVLGLGWLVVSFLQWRDLLRIQFWIGGVILLGMLEMATFYAEYSSINSTGGSPGGAVLLAELVSCAKRTLARMLVIVVSLGFGIVKPRLGGMLHRVVGVGVLYFVLAGTEAYMRVMRPKSDPANQMLIASVPLAVLDSGICWWIFTSLVQTTRTLRLRRNLVKLALYRHFTNTLVFAVMASVIFMLYSIKAHHLTVCFTDWKELWIDDAYWRLLFSVILLVIMILWRPTNNNQRYAFSPLLDAPEDDDDEEEEQFINDAYGVKMRSQSGGAVSPKPKTSSNSADDDLKWVEENIPASLADTALPILDSEEEIMTTRFELSKMQ